VRKNRKKGLDVKSTHKDKDLKILLDISRTVSSSINFDEVKDLILKKARWALKTDHASLFLLGENGGHLMLSGVEGFNKNEMDNLALLGSWERINYQVARQRKPLIVNSLVSHPVFKKERLPFAKRQLPLNSFLSVPLKTEVKLIGVLIVSNRKGHRRIFAKKDKNLLMALANHVSIALLNAKLYKELEEMLVSTVKSLANAIDAKDPYTHGHSERVMKYSLAIAKRMRLSKDFMSKLRLSGLLHDIGKIGIKDAILGKKERLTKQEAEVMRKHPLIGVKIVSSMVGSEDIIHGIADHHEWVNGKGYPKRLKGNKISLEGRIIAIADAFDALTTDRPYQKKFSSKAACIEIARNAGVQFDPRATKAFLQSFSKENHIWQT